MASVIKVFLVPVNGEPRVVEVHQDDDRQVIDMIGGGLEMLRPFESYVAFCDSDRSRKQLLANLTLPNIGPVVGPIVFARPDRASLTDDDINRLRAISKTYKAPLL